MAGFDASPGMAGPTIGGPQWGTQAQYAQANSAHQRLMGMDPNYQQQYSQQQQQQYQSQPQFQLQSQPKNVIKGSFVSNLEEARGALIDYTDGNLHVFPCPQERMIYTKTMEGGVPQFKQYKEVEQQMNAPVQQAIQEKYIAEDVFISIVGDLKQKVEALEARINNATIKTNPVELKMGEVKSETPITTEIATKSNDFSL